MLLTELERWHREWDALCPVQRVWARRWAKLCCNWLINRRGKVMDILGIPHPKRVKFKEFKEHVSSEQLGRVILEQMSEEDKLLCLQARL